MVSCESRRVPFRVGGSQKRVEMLGSLGLELANWFQLHVNGDSLEVCTASAYQLQLTEPTGTGMGTGPDGPAEGVHIAYMVRFVIVVISSSVTSSDGKMLPVDGLLLG